MAAEAETHRGEELVGKAVVGPAAIAGEQRSGENVCRDSHFHRGLDRPLPFPAVGDPSRELLELVVPSELERAKIEEPGRDDRSAAPDFGNVGEV